MIALTLDTSNRIADETLTKGREIDCAPLTVAVLDAGGHLVVLKREDRSGIIRPQIAIGKAWGVLGMGFGGRELARRAGQAPMFFNALSDLSEGKMIPVPGGVLIRSDGQVVGAVGVSGDTSERDEEAAVAGVTAAGLEADTGEGP